MKVYKKRKEKCLEVAVQHEVVRTESQKITKTLSMVQSEERKSYFIAFENCRPGWHQQKGSRMPEYPLVIPPSCRIEVVFELAAARFRKRDERQEACER